MSSQRARGWLGQEVCDMYGVILFESKSDFWRNRNRTIGRGPYVRFRNVAAAKESQGKYSRFSARIARVELWMNLKFIHLVKVQMMIQY